LFSRKSKTTRRWFTLFLVLFDFFGDHLSLIFVDKFNLLELLKFFLSGNNCRLIFALKLLNERHLEQEEALSDFFEIQILGFED